MSRYGTDIYGVGYYGAGVLALIDFDASPFTAKPINYGTIELNWTTPTGTWSKLRLVRNRYGYPIAADDGDVLFEELKEDASTNYIDRGQVPSFAGLKQGGIYHYSLFVYSDQQSYWIKAGNAVSISAKEFNAKQNMYSLLPAVYQTESYKTITSSNENSDLKCFLNIFEAYYDFAKTYAELTFNMYDTSLTYPTLIPSVMQQFGLKYEPELGLQQSRIFLRNASLLNKKKGSLIGVSDFVKAFTGWDSNVKDIKNLMLNYNDSSFEQTTGAWEIVDNATLSVKPFDQLAPYSTPELETAGWPIRQKGSLKVVATDSGDVELICGLTDMKTKAIPVKPGVPYTFSIFTQSAGSNRKVYVDIWWYDRTLNQISRAGEQSKTNTNTGWNTRVETTSDSPDDAWFAVPYIRIENCSSDEIHYFDAAQFEINSEGATYYQDARTIEISLHANRINLIDNPCFEVNTAPWTAENASLTQDTTQFEENEGSVGSGKLTATANGVAQLTYNKFISVVPGEWYTMSGYVRTAYTGVYADDRMGEYDVEWYDGSQQFISTSSTSPKKLTEFYNVTAVYRTNNILYMTIDELPSVVPSEEIRLINFVIETVDQNLNPVTYTLDGSYTVVNVVGNEIQVVSSGANFSLITDFGSGDLPVIQDLKLYFNRISTSVLSPINAAYAKPIFKWTNAEIGQDLWFDSQLFERSTSEGTFFDGSRGVSEPTDLIWEDEVSGSRSHYYKNRIAVEKRLIEQLPNYLNYGTSFILTLANPEDI